MGLPVGIVGLPNVGKSTTFNALTKAQNAESANYPFCTIEPNKAVVPVPDPRLDELAKIVNPERIQLSTIDFVDIAGLVKGASKGEGLGNQFLSNIRETEMILHMVRCFEDENITHVEGGIDPLRDIEIIESELIFADIQQLEKKIERLARQSKTGDKKMRAQLEVAQELMKHLEEIKPVSTFENREDENFKQLDKELRFLSNKPIIYGALLAAVFDEIFIGDHFGTDKSLFEVIVDDAGRFGGFPSFMNRPGTHLFDTGGEIADKAKALERGSDDLVQT